MTLYEYIMGSGNSTFSKADWSALGSGELTDEETIGKMLMEGYEAVADAD